jgi:uncharacterized protein
VAEDATDRLSPTRTVVRFCRELRDEGLSVPVANVVSYVHALGAVGVRRTRDVYWAGRATLVRRPEDVEAYDRVFGAFFSDTGFQPPRRVEVPVMRRLRAAGVASEDAGEGDGVLRYSAAEVLREKDFAACTEEELAQAVDAMRELALTTSSRPSHRWKLARHAARPDLRSTVRRSMRRGGEVVTIERVRRVPRVRRLVLICDVSGSMEPYARALLRFAHILVAGRASVEAFALGTRLTRLTRQLSSRDPDAAMAAASAVVPDWSGGTRLGAGLREFNDRFGVAGMARGAQVVVLSDGWDRGDPAELGEQMARLRRVAHLTVWVNPLKAAPDYQPLAQGMAAALPHVDRFLPGHNVASLEALLEVLAT